LALDLVCLASRAGEAAAGAAAGAAAAEETLRCTHDAERAVLDRQTQRKLEIAAAAGCCKVHWLPFRLNASLFSVNHLLV
jgi:hypothetical protein